MKHAAAPVRAGDTVPLRDQMACVTRELAMRRRVYPRFVSQGRMTVEEATREAWHMQAVLDTLRALTGQPTATQPDMLAEAPQ
jgi:hypothetical protein